jgi:hypothetical protein
MGMKSIKQSVPGSQTSVFSTGIIMAKAESQTERDDFTHITEICIYLWHVISKEILIKILSEKK